MNMNFVVKAGKVLVKYAGPLAEGAMAVVGAIESQKQKQTIAELVAKVAELESKIK